MELYHYGVKGQRWGVRRYQNKDGTLTAAGKQHYRSDRESDNALMSRDWADLYSDIHKKSGDWYHGTGVSAGFKRVASEYKNELNKVYNSKRTPAVDAHEKAQAELNSFFNSELDKLSKGKLGALRQKNSASKIRTIPDVFKRDENTTPCISGSTPTWRECLNIRSLKLFAMRPCDSRRKTTLQ